jgi:hypothetical protein
MFTTSWEKYPSKPVITSLTAAEAELQHWLRENQFKEIKDQAGILWQLQLDVHQGPSPSFESGAFWRIILSVQTKVTATQLLMTGTFDSVGDARLLKMLDESIICIKLKPRTLCGHQLDQLRMALMETLGALRVFLESHSFHDVKRRICGEWLDQRCLFK